MNMNDGEWNDFNEGEHWDPKRMRDPKHIKELLTFMTKINGMEAFLMQTAFESIEDDMGVFFLYPQTEIEEQSIQDLIHFYSDKEEFEKCALIVKYLEEGKNRKTMPSNESKR